MSNDETQAYIDEQGQLQIQLSEDAQRSLREFLQELTDSTSRDAAAKDSAQQDEKSGGFMELVSGLIAAVVGMFVSDDKQQEESRQNEKSPEGIDLPEFGRKEGDTPSRSQNTPEQAIVGGAAGTDFYDALAAHESSHNYEVVNDIGYAGMYQMGKPALIDAGYIENDGSMKNDWQNAQWTGKDGINSLDDFLKTPAAQENAVRDYHETQWNTMERLGLTDQIGKEVNGVEVTASGLIAGAHLKGVGGVRDFLNGRDNADANGTTVSHYMNEMGGLSVDGKQGEEAGISLAALMEDIMDGNDVSTPYVPPVQEENVSRGVG